MRASPLDSHMVTIDVTYKLPVSDTELTEEDVLELIEHEPIPHVLTLLRTGTGLEWRRARENINVSVDEIHTED